MSFFKPRNTTASSTSSNSSNAQFIGVQAKLNIGKSNDKYEKEADSVADRVVQKQGFFGGEPFFAPAPQLQRTDEGEKEVQKSEETEQIQEKPLHESITPLVQTKPEEDPVQRQEEEESVQMEAEEEPVQMMEEEESIQTKAEEENIQPKVEEDPVQKQEEEETVQAKEEETDVQKKTEPEEANVQTKELNTSEPTPIQRKDEEIQEKEEEIQEKEEEESVQRKNSADAGDTSNLESNLAHSKGGGSPMDSGTKGQMESGFGTDFSGVRIHNDSNAVQMNKELGAQAFTNGNDIYFNEGKYNPNSKEGQHLLAHELTHTVQQGGSSSLAQKKEEDAALPAPYHWPNAHLTESEDEVLANGIIKTFKKDPSDADGKVRRRLAALNSVQKDAVLGRAKSTLGETEYEQFNTLIGKEVPASGVQEPKVKSYSIEQTYEGGEKVPEVDTQNDQATKGNEAGIQNEKNERIESETGEKTETINDPANAEEEGSEETSEKAETNEEESTSNEGNAVEGNKEGKPQASPEKFSLQTSEASSQQEANKTESSNPFEGIDLSLPEGYVSQQPELVAEKSKNAQTHQRRLQDHIKQIRFNLEEQKTSRLSTLKTAVDEEKSKIQLKSALASDQIRNQYAIARADINLNGLTKKLELQALISTYRETIINTENLKREELTTNKEASIQSLIDSNVNYEAQSNAYGVREAARSRNDANQKAQIARNKGRRRKAAVSGDADLKALKREGIQEIITATVDHVLEVGEETAIEVMGMAEDARGKFADELPDKIQEIERFHEMAIGRLPEMSQAALQVYADMEIRLPEVIDQMTASLIEKLDIKESEALDSVNTASQTHLAQLDELYRDTAYSINSQHQSFLGQLQEAETQYTHIVASTPHPNYDKVADITDQTIDAINADVEAYQSMLSQSTDQIQALIPGITSALDAGISQLHSSVMDHIVKATTGLISMLDKLHQETQIQLDQAKDGFLQSIEDVVVKTNSEYTTLTTEFGAEVNSALVDLEANMKLAVDESIAHNQEEIDVLEGSGKISEAEQRAEEEYNQSWWEGFINTLVSGLLIGLLVFVAIIGLVALGIISAKAALIIGLVMLAVGVVVAVGQRLYSLWESGAPWYQWVIYLGLAFNPITGPVILILDGLGLVGLVEGLVGYDFVTWQELSGYDAGSRTGKGVVSIILLIVSFGTSRVMTPKTPAVEVLPAPPRPALPPGPAPRPTIIDLVYNPRTGVWEMPTPGGSSPAPTPGGGAPLLPGPARPPALPAPVEPPLLPATPVRPPSLPAPVEPPLLPAPPVRPPLLPAPVDPPLLPVPTRPPTLPPANRPVVPRPVQPSITPQQRVSGILGEQITNGLSHSEIQALNRLNNQEISGLRNQPLQTIKGFANEIIEGAVQIGPRGGVRGRDVYDLVNPGDSNRSITSLIGRKTDGPSVSDIFKLMTVSGRNPSIRPVFATRMGGSTLSHSGSNAFYDFVVPVKISGGGSIEVNVRVTIKAQGFNTRGGTLSAPPGGGAHGGNSGPATFSLQFNQSGSGEAGQWVAVIDVDPNIQVTSPAKATPVSPDFESIVGHELDEIADIVANNHNLTGEVPGTTLKNDLLNQNIATQQQASMFRPDVTEPSPPITSHDKAAAQELMTQFQQMTGNPSEAFTARYNRLLDSMGFTDTIDQTRFNQLIQALRTSGQNDTAFLTHVEAHWHFKVSTRTLSSVTPGELLPGNHKVVTPDVIGHILQPQPSANFVTSGMSGGHEQARLLAQNANAAGPFFVVQEGSLSLPYGTALRFRQYEIVAGVSKATAPRPVPVTGAPTPGTGTTMGSMPPAVHGTHYDNTKWTVSNVPKSTVDNMGSFIPHAERAFADFFRTSVQGTITTPQNGVWFRHTFEGVTYAGFYNYDGSNVSSLSVNSIFVDAYSIP